MSTGRDETAKELIHAFKRLHKVLHKSVYRSLSRELKPSPFMVMMHLRRVSRTKPEGQRVSDIADTVGMTAAAITQILNGLEKDGYIRRETDPGDRRVVLVHLTEAGETLMEPAFRNFSEMFEGLVNHLGEENARVLADLLNRVEDYFQDR